MSSMSALRMGISLRKALRHNRERHRPIKSAVKEEAYPTEPILSVTFATVSDHTSAIDLSELRTAGLPQKEDPGRGRGRCVSDQVGGLLGFLTRGASGDRTNG
jgi:hypothetical protein